jgi:hypothetical protein
MAHGRESFDITQDRELVERRVERVLGFKGSRVDHSVFKVFTGPLEPLNPNICPLEKNGRDRILGIPLSDHDTFFKVISMSSSASDQISGV